jgi:hypothetical protein
VCVCVCVCVCCVCHALSLVPALSPALFQLLLLVVLLLAGSPTMHTRPHARLSLVLSCPPALTPPRHVSHATHTHTDVEDAMLSKRANARAKNARSGMLFKPSALEKKNKQYALQNVAGLHASANGLNSSSSSSTSTSRKAVDKQLPPSLSAGPLFVNGPLGAAVVRKEKQND